MVGAADNRSSCSGIFAQHRQDDYRDGVAHIQGADADEKRAAGSRERDGLDSGFEDSERSGRSAADARSVPRSYTALTLQSVLFPSDKSPSGYQRTPKTTWDAALLRAQVPYFRIYDLRSTYATRLSAGGVADEWVTQMLRQGDAQVFKKYSQMKLQMKREALEKLNRRASEMASKNDERMCTVVVQ